MNVSAISTATNKVDATIPVKSNPHGIVYDPANGDIYVANQGFGTVSVIDTATNIVTGDITVGSNPEGIAYDPANGDIYVTLRDFVAIIDGTTNSVIKGITVGSHPFGVAYDSTHKRMYVTNSFSNDVSVINATSNTLVNNSTIPVGNRPLDIAFNPSNNAMYATNSLSNTVTVLSTLDHGELDLAASADNTTVTDDEDGQPLVGLTLNNFKVATMVSPDDGEPIQITSVAAGTLPGFYRINIVPSGNATWKSGDYIFSIVATNEQAKGQNLVHVYTLKDKIIKISKFLSMLDMYLLLN
jgi:YVTN family beta-propeller protein